MMSSFFCGSEADLENQLSELLPDRRSAMCYFSFMVIFLFMIEQFAPSMLVFVVVGIFLVPGILWMYCSYQQRRGEVHAAVLNESRVHTDQQVQMNSFGTRPNLPAIRTQLSHLDQEFNGEASGDDTTVTFSVSVGEFKKVEHVRRLSCLDELTT